MLTLISVLRKLCYFVNNIFCVIIYFINRSKSKMLQSVNMSMY